VYCIEGVELFEKYSVCLNIRFLRIIHDEDKVGWNWGEGKLHWRVDTSTLGIWRKFKWNSRSSGGKTMGGKFAHPMTDDGVTSPALNSMVLQWPAMLQCIIIVLRKRFAAGTSGRIATISLAVTGVCKRICWGVHECIHTVIREFPREKIIIIREVISVLYRAVCCQNI